MQTCKFFHAPKNGDICIYDLNSHSDFNGGSLYLSGCDLKRITLPEKVGGYLDLRDCNLKGITLSERVGGSLYLKGCDLKNIKIPEKFKDKIRKV